MLSKRRHLRLQGHFDGGLPMSAQCKPTCASRCCKVLRDCPLHRSHACDCGASAGEYVGAEPIVGIYGADGRPMPGSELEKRVAMGAAGEEARGGEAERCYCGRPAAFLCHGVPTCYEQRCHACVPIEVAEAPKRPEAPCSECGLTGAHKLQCVTGGYERQAFSAEKRPEAPERALVCAQTEANPFMDEGPFPETIVHMRLDGRRPAGAPLCGICKDRGDVGSGCSACGKLDAVGCLSEKVSRLETELAEANDEADEAMCALADTEFQLSEAWRWVEYARLAVMCETERADFAEHQRDTALGKLKEARAEIERLSVWRAEEAEKVAATAVAERDKEIARLQAREAGIRHVVDTSTDTMGEVQLIRKLLDAK